MAEYDILARNKQDLALFLFSIFIDINHSKPFTYK